MNEGKELIAKEKLASVIKENYFARCNIDIKC